MDRNSARSIIDNCGSSEECPTAADEIPTSDGHSDRQNLIKSDRTCFQQNIEL